ncbi:MAG TPA: acyl carrier protein [Myxococcota bacterium]|nr:acyl carrier protein [Myxococcota bacterium]
MTREDIRTAVLASLAEIAPEADLARLPPGAELREVLDLDSMDFLRFLQALAEATGIEVPESEVSKLATLGACIDYLAARAG